jgi:hypothetical protein
MKEIKMLYETSVKKQIEEPSIEIKEEQGQKVEIKRIIKKVKPVKVGLLKPDRRLFKAAEMFYAKALSEYLKAGLLPYSLVFKRYANDGGPLTDKERERLKELRDEARQLEVEFYSSPVADDPEAQKKKNQALLRINEINLEITNIQNAYADIYDSTAEMKARNDTIEWWILHLLYIEQEGKGYVPFFGEGTNDELLNKLDAFEDKEDPFEIEVIKKLSYFVSFWFTSRNAVTKIDFDSMERLYNDTMTDYKVVESEEVKVTDKTPAPIVPGPVGTAAILKVLEEKPAPAPEPPVQTV